MSLFVEVENLTTGCKTILNLDHVVEIYPVALGGCHIIVNVGGTSSIVKVKDNYSLFKQFVMQTVSSEDIASKVAKLKS